MAEFIVINDREWEIIKSSDVIEADSAKGKKFWQGHIVANRDPFDNYYTCSSAWHTTKDGMSKVVWSTPYYATPTNMGRSNERNNYDQAHFEFDSMVQKQKDKRNAEKPLPMLAHSFSKREKDIKYPCAVQPKYDGMRCLYDGEDAWSRGNKPIIPEVFTHLHFNTHGYIIDGELILPDNVKINKTMEAAKKYRKGISDQLLYRVYDIVSASLSFNERFDILTKIVKESKNINIILAETLLCETKDDIFKFHEDFTRRGFEGTIIRNLDGKYAINKRSADLQKYKDFFDAEFLIVDIIPAGGGSSSDVGKFICVTENGDQFESTATGTEEERRNYLLNKHQFINKYAVVKYREMSGKNGVPFHSNVLTIRDTKEEGH